MSNQERFIIELLRTCEETHVRYKGIGGTLTKGLNGFFVFTPREGEVALMSHSYIVSAIECYDLYIVN